MKTAHEILQAAQQRMKDRASTYDKPEGERSMKGTVDAFKAITGVTLTEEQGWLFMAVLKAVRNQQGGYRDDSYTDGAAYFALAGEAAGVYKNPDAEWIKWDGKSLNGPTGLHGETRVNVIFRGEDESADTAGAFKVRNLYWGVNGRDTDIIAYRIVK